MYSLCRSAVVGKPRIGQQMWLKGRDDDVKDGNDGKRRTVPNHLHHQR